MGSAVMVCGSSVLSTAAQRERVAALSSSEAGITHLRITASRRHSKPAVCADAVVERPRRVRACRRQLQRRRRDPAALAIMLRRGAPLAGCLWRLPALA